jgi:hypothetical protein
MQFSDDDLADIVGDSNGPAYRKAEQRTGPPLDYVAEKAEVALLASHEALRSIRLYVPDDLPQPELARGTSFSTKKDGLVSPAWAAFRYGLVSFLALQNMLSLANDAELPDRLADMSYEEFRGWLHGVSSEGSVTG